jgi:hypothetical protein
VVGDAAFAGGVFFVAMLVIYLKAGSLLEGGAK